MASDRPLFAMALMCAFCVIAPLLDVAAKLAAATLPAGQITFARMAVQALVMAPVMAAMGLSWGLGGRALGLMAVRAALLIASTFAFVAAIAVMPIADALAIVFVAPFLLLLFGHLIFGDRVGPRRIAACAVGFAGALLVIRPSIAVFGTTALLPLGTALAFALYMLVTRALAAGVHPVAMQAQTAVIGTVLCLPVLLWADGSGIAALDPVAPQGLAWLWLAGVGAFAAASHLCMTYALKFAPSATLAPLHYLEIVVAVALGYLIWGDFPAPLTWAGITVIVASGLYILWRERVTSRQAAPPAPPRRARAAG